MELRVLRYFLEVARERSVTRAAASLHVSQPTLSKQLKDLEKELGHTLFHRTNYGINLTDEGMLLRKRAEEIVDMVEKTEGEFKSLAEELGGDVRIGCAESEDMKYVARCAKAVQDLHPGVRIHLYSGNGEDLADRLEGGTLDFAVLAHEVDPTRYSWLDLPGEDTWGVIMREDSVLAGRDTITADDLMGAPLILSRQTLTSTHPAWFGERVDALNVVATYNLVFNAAIMVREGLGYAISFDRLTNTEAGSGLTFRPLEPAITTKLHVAWKKYQTFTPAAQLLLDEMRKAFAARTRPEAPTGGQTP